MPLAVVDASAIAALAFREQSAEAVGRRLTDRGLVGPTLLPYELGNVCVKKIRSHPAQREALVQNFLAALHVVGDLRPVDPHGCLVLALAFRLTMYDASYLWLAQSLDAELVTLDERLAKADAALRA